MNDLVEFALGIEAVVGIPAFFVTLIEYSVRVQRFRDFTSQGRRYGMSKSSYEKKEYEYAMSVKRAGRWIILALLWPIGLIALAIKGLRIAFSHSSEVGKVISKYELAEKERAEANMRAEIERQRQKVRDDAEKRRKMELMSWDEIFDDLSRQIGTK